LVGKFQKRKNAKLSFLKNNQYIKAKTNGCSLTFDIPNIANDYLTVALGGVAGSGQVTGMH